MIVGIGTDITSAGRIQGAAARRGDAFLDRVFTPGERSYCEKKKGYWQCYAARFAGKEAVFKALGTGMTKSRWKDVEIINEISGKPRVFLYGGAAEAAREKGVKEVFISISHEGDRAVAFAIAVEAGGGVYFAGSNSC